MTKPVILVVDGDPSELSLLLSDLVNRFGSDYRVAAHLTCSAAIADLETIRKNGEQLALVIADQWLTGMDGIEILAKAHEVHPSAQRALLVGWGDRKGSEQILQGCAYGHLDNYLLKPWSPAEVYLYPFISEFLAEWTRAHRPGMEVVRVIGEGTDIKTHELRTVLARNGIPHGFYEAASEDGTSLLDQVGRKADELPVVILLDGHAMVNPTFKEIADELGANDSSDQVYDVAIVGGGPSGLAAAVYAASEGLSTVVIEREAIGGQASTTSLIRNYLGFPRGIGGAELAQRAYQQAWLFGTKFMFARNAVSLDSAGDEKILTLSDDSKVRCRSVIIATGASYRRLRSNTMERFVGCGILYTAFTFGVLVRGAEVFVAGAGNSAGQAVVSLAKEASKVTLLVRGPDLERSMSAYLIQEIRHLSNVEVLFNTEVVDAEGEASLERLVLQNVQSGETTKVDTRMLYVLIGAEPYTNWLDGFVEREKGYVVTSPTRTKSWRLERSQLPFETSQPGVFAVGDVRFGSTKRVASAAGEGSAAVSSVHQYIQLVNAEITENAASVAVAAVR